MPEDADTDDEEDRNGPFKPAANGKQKKQKGEDFSHAWILQPSQKC